MPLLWSRLPLKAGQRGRVVLLRGMLAVLDRRFERQFRTLLSHALPTRGYRREARPLVCVAIGTLGPGGAERQLVNTLTGLKALFDVDVEVLAMYLHDESFRFFVPALEAAGVHVSSVPRELSAGAIAIDGSPDAARLADALQRHVPADMGHIASFTQTFLKKRPDVVHLWLDEINVKAGLAAALVGVPRIVLSMRSVNPSHFAFFQPYMKSGYRVLLERPQTSGLNNSQTGADDYSRWLGLAPGTIRVLRNGFDFERLFSESETTLRRASYRRANGIPSDAFVAGGVMRLSEEKRPLLWLAAMEIVATACPDVHFLLVGDGVQRPLVDARIAERGLRPRVHSVGHEQKPYDSIAAMDVLFLSSVFEGSPNVLIEAQALGVPVVTTPAGGAVETVDDGRTGWVIRSGTAEEAAKRIIELVRDPSLGARVGAAAPLFVRERFGMARMLAETAEAYGGLPLRSGETARV
jgi:glycosyltransferase involved in cell wall biosynthesis